MSEKHLDTFSIKLSAPVWNLLPVAKNSLIVIEQRDEMKRLTSFSAYNFVLKQFLWRDVVLPEKWWVNLAGVTECCVVLKVFESTQNPDKSSFLFLDMVSGKIMEPEAHQANWIHTTDTVYPFQYLDGEPDFNTVKKFLSSKLNESPKLGADYAEYDDYVIISYYVGNPAAFVNRLVVFNFKGECVYEDEIGTNLKGIGINTFFIAMGYLFFVKNKTELVTFRIV